MMMEMKVHELFFMKRAKADVPQCASCAFWKQSSDYRRFYGKATVVKYDLNPENPGKCIHPQSVITYRETKPEDSCKQWALGAHTAKIGDRLCATCERWVGGRKLAGKRTVTFDIGPRNMGRCLELPCSDEDELRTKPEFSCEKWKMNF